MNELFAVADAAAPAAAPAGAAPQADGSTSMMLFLLVAMVIMIFFSFRSQKKQQRKKAEMLSQIVKGTKVLLANGIYGVVNEVKGDDFVVEIADKVCVTVIRGGVARVVEEEKAKENK